MKKIQITLVSLLVVCFTACTSDIQDMPTYNDQTNQSPTNPYRVSLSQALATVQPLFNNMDEGKATRSSRIISNVDYITSTIATRGDSDVSMDTLLYVVNFDDENGFAVLGADKRVPAVLAISDEGNLDLNDTTENKPLAFWLDDVKSSLKIRPDSIPTSAPDPIDPGFGDRKITVLSDIKPYISGMPRLWGQGKPYNALCQAPNGSTCPVGCGPLAAAIIMSYYKWPITIPKARLNWDIMTSTLPDYNYQCKNLLQQLMLYTRNTLKAKYENGQTTMTNEQFQNNFPLCGYELIGKAKDFRTGHPGSALKNGPLVVAAEEIGKEIGHMWVIDGEYSIKEEWDALLEPFKIYIVYHCVWGRDGMNNGYFAFVGNSNDEYIDETNNGASLTGKGYDDAHNKTSHKYHNLKYWGNFKARK